MGQAYEPEGPVMRVLQVLIHRALCEPCIEALSGLAAADVEGALHRLTALSTITALSAVCERCQRETAVFRLVRH